MLISGFHRGVN